MSKSCNLNTLKAGILPFVKRDLPILAGMLFLMLLLIFLVFQIPYWYALAVHYGEPEVAGASWLFFLSSSENRLYLHDSYSDAMAFLGIFSGIVYGAFLLYIAAAWICERGAQSLAVQGTEKVDPEEVSA